MIFEFPQNIFKFEQLTTNSRLPLQDITNFPRVQNVYVKKAMRGQEMWTGVDSRQLQKREDERDEVQTTANQRQRKHDNSYQTYHR